MRIFLFGLADVVWLTAIFWILAVLTMTVGNILALRQSNVKRMLAYSSIAHAGYVLVALTVGTQDAISAAIFYLVGYAVFNLGAFAVLTLLETRAGRTSEFSEITGLAKANPVIAALLALFMFALSGFPPTIGFFGKFYVFTAAVKNGFIMLTVIGVLNSFVSVYYYLSVIKTAYFETADQPFESPTIPPAIFVTLLITAIGTLGLGLFPSQLLKFSQEAFFAFF
jgi:NADH-quinone oxidoreductase subunit N